MALAASRALGERWTVSLGATAGRSTEDGADLREAGLGATALYALVPGRLSLDGGLWAVRGEDAGEATGRLAVALGFYATF